MKVNRRKVIADAAALSGVASTLSFFPSLIGSAQTDQVAGSRPKIRAVIRLQMYAGWDVSMGCDPPVEPNHATTYSNQQLWQTHWNFPSGVSIPRAGSSGSLAGLRAMDQAIRDKLGSSFFNNPSAGIRRVKGAAPGTAVGASPTFETFDPSVGSDPARLPFAASTTDPGWTRAHPGNPDFVVGPLMHQFLNTYDRKPGSTAPLTDRYADAMTITNGIDTNLNVLHDAGAVLAATGYLPPGIGNGNDIRALAFLPSIEMIMANQMIKSPSVFLPSIAISPPLVSGLTFTSPGFRRGYAHSDLSTGRTQLFDVTSLNDLNAKTSLTIPTALQTTSMLNVINQFKAGRSADPMLSEAYKTFADIANKGGLGLAFGQEERDAFGNMIEVVYDASAVSAAESTIPPVALFQRQGGARTPIVNWPSVDPASLRHSLDGSVQGSWQNNLATAALMVRQGYTRGASISFGGHINFIPDTHYHNDNVQMMYQGIFWDGVKRLMNYLKWNLDSDGKPLLDSTLIVVSADIIRGPTYFDSGPQGRSDYRNNSMVLIGGGLNHKTRGKDGSLRPGRRICYSCGSMNSGRINLSDGKPTAPPLKTADRPEEAVTFNKIYASLLECYGMEKDIYYKGVQTIGPIASNKPIDGT